MKKCRQARDQVLADSKYQPVLVFELLLDTAELELNVRETFRNLLTNKKTNWERCKSECIERLTELADVFGGTKPLTRIEKNGTQYKSDSIFTPDNVSRCIIYFFFFLLAI